MTRHDLHEGQHKHQCGTILWRNILHQLQCCCWCLDVWLFWTSVLLHLPLTTGSRACITPPLYTIGTYKCSAEKHGHIGKLQKSGSSGKITSTSLLGKWRRWWQIFSRSHIPSPLLIIAGTLEGVSVKYLSVHTSRDLDRNLKAETKPLILTGNVLYSNEKQRKKLNMSSTPNNYPPKVKRKWGQEASQISSLFHSTKRGEWWRISRLTWPGSCHPISSLSHPISSHHCAGWPACSWDHKIWTPSSRYFFLPLESVWTATRTASACPQFNNNKKMLRWEDVGAVPLD